MRNSSTIFTLSFLIMLITTLTAQVPWEKDQSNPVLKPGPHGTWEDYEVYAPFVIKHEDTLKMWYSGSESFQGDMIGYAISFDGIQWDKYQNNPVLDIGAPGSWDSWETIHPRILIVEGTYHMWYGGSDDHSSISYRVGYATSLDGINWEKYPDPVLGLGDSGEWDSATLGGHCYYFDGDSFHVWYGGCDNTDFSHTCIGYAKSADGINWVKYPDNPVFCGTGSWDSVAVFPSCIIVDDSGYKMWYWGYDGFHGRIGYVTSSDGITWTEYESNPVLDVGESGSWEDESIGQPHVIIEDSTYYMWYAGYRSNSGGRIGYAHEPFSAIDRTDLIHNPEEFILNQNYPNPYNPSTTIEFTLPKSEFVTLKIYNILGEDVATLVQDKLQAGNHTYQFDGSSLASGVYMYKIEAGEFQQVRKMVLIK